MVRDGYFYALALIAAAVLLGWLTQPVWAIIPCLLALFFLVVLSRSRAGRFHRMPGQLFPRLTAKSPMFRPVTVGNQRQMRVSIFLSVFDVHVNRSPIAGVVRDVRYQRGKYLNAMNRRLSREK